MISPTTAFAIVSFFLGELGEGLNTFEVRTQNAVLYAQHVFAIDS